MKKVLMLPLILFVLLALAWALRWENISTKTYNNGVLKWKKDKWTNFVWIEIYGASNGILTVEERPAYNDKDSIDRVWQARNRATIVWRILIGADCLWMLLALIIFAKKSQKEDRPGLNNSG